MKIGDKITAEISATGRKNTGTVTYIHPQNRFYMVTFCLGAGDVRECYPMDPQPEPDPKPARCGFHQGNNRAGNYYINRKGAGK